MSNRADGWIDSALAAIGKAAGSEEAARIYEAWSAHQAQPLPVVTLFGPYDSGKSSLLKRLLVEAGCDIPEWVTVSARRETFETSEVTVGFYVVHDTPGIAGGNAQHDALASAAAALTDAILLVLPPQLLTSNREGVLAILGGTTYRPEGLPLGDALLVAVCRMDEAGVDPGADESGYRSLCASKLQELAVSFERDRIPVTRDQLFAVAADPYQQVGNSLPTSLQSYAAGAWDGVAGLKDALVALPARLSALRAGAARRYFCGTATALVTQIDDRLRKVVTAAEEATNGARRLELFGQQLTSLASAADADLERVVDEQVASIIQSGLTAGKEIKEALEPRMIKALEHWQATHWAAIEKFAEEAKAEVESRATSPGGRTLRLLFAPAEKSSASKDVPMPHLSRAGSALRKGLRTYHEVNLGAPLKQVREEISRLSQAGSFEKYAEAAGKAKSALKSAEHARSAQKIVRLHDAIDIIGPVLSELIPLVVEEVQRNQRAAERAAERSRLRERAAAASREMSAGFLAEWNAQAGALREDLRKQQQQFVESRDALGAEKAMLEVNRQGLIKVLASA